LNPLAENPATLWPLAVYFLAVIFLAAAMIALSYFLGQRHQERATGEPYESGIVSTGTSRVRLSANFYLIAMFFVIFDLETVFIFAWAVSAREAGWAGYAEILVFIVILLAALVYLWRLGALDWGTSPKRKALALQRKGGAVHGLVAEQTR
jgi:NADH-quinone oxidoreductase subunit A